CIMASCVKIPMFITNPDPGKFERYVNGQDFVPINGYESSLLSQPNVTADVEYRNGSYIINISTLMRIKNQPSKYLDLSLQNVTDTGFYQFNDIRHQEGTYQYNSNAYRAYKPSQGGLTITKFDNVN